MQFNYKKCVVGPHFCCPSFFCTRVGPYYTRVVSHYTGVALCFTRVVLVLCRVVSCCTRGVLCWLKLLLVLCRVVLVLSRVGSCCYSGNFLDEILDDNTFCKALKGQLLHYTFLCSHNTKMLTIQYKNGWPAASDPFDMFTL